MPRTVDHIVETHHLATERRRAGKPVWAHTLDVSSVFHNEDLTFEQRRDGIVALIKATGWYKGEDEYSELHEITENIADAANTDEFDSWWDVLYDAADYDRVWINTH